MTPRDEDHLGADRAAAAGVADAIDAIEPVFDGVLCAPVVRRMSLRSSINGQIAMIYHVG